MLQKEKGSSEVEVLWKCLLLRPLARQLHPTQQSLPSQCKIFQQLHSSQLLVSVQKERCACSDCKSHQAHDMDWLLGIFGVCSSRGAKAPPPAADMEKDSSAYKGPCAEDGDLPDDLMAPGRLYNLCKAKEAPPIDLVQQLLSDPTKKNERISYKSPKDNECAHDDAANHAS